MRFGVAILLVAALVAATVIARSVNGPWFDRAYLIVLENHGYEEVVGNSQAPYLNHLIAGYGLATHYDAVAHPSTPDYFAMLAGSTFGIHDDSLHDVTAPNLFDQLEQRGKSWHVYAQDYPGGCFTGMQSAGGPDLGPAGTYVRRHNPAISFTDISRNPARCARITSLSTFDPGAADFEMVVPNDMNNMHDGSIQQADSFLASFVPRILSNPDFAHGVLFITFDEGSGNEAGGGRVPMIVVRPGIAPGFRSPTAHTHRALLRTIEDAWGLACLAESCQSPAMSEFFGR